MRSKKQLAEIYFSHNPTERDIAQQKENGKTEKELGKLFRAQGYSHSDIKRLRKYLMALLNADGWDDICRQLVIMGIIKPGKRQQYIFDEKPTQALIDAVDDLECEPDSDDVEKKNKQWSADRKRLNYQ